jgi:hypothetical protein
VFVDRLADKHAETIFKITLPPVIAGGRLVTPPRTWTQRYALVREVAPGVSLFDVDQRLSEVLALSRLVYPTAMSLRYSCRVTFSNRVITELDPADPMGIGRGAWVANANGRAYLTMDEWKSVGRSFATDPFNTQSERWKRAMWFFEYASRTQSGSVRWTLAVTALESLVHTDRMHSTRQFVARSVALAHMVGVHAWTKDVASAAYDVRSGLAHGQAASQLTHADEAQAALALEPLLRAILLRAVEDPNLGDLFRDDSQVRSLA